MILIRQMARRTLVAPFDYNRFNFAATLSCLPSLLSCSWVWPYFVTWLSRYMLLTFEEYPRNIKAGWKENLQTFMNELKNLEASGMTTMGSALKQVFDTLNINRMQTGIDMYGQGRYPFYLEPAVIVVISDGGKLTTQGRSHWRFNIKGLDFHWQYVLIIVFLSFDIRNCPIRTEPPNAFVCAGIRTDEGTIPMGSKAICSCSQDGR